MHGNDHLHPLFSRRRRHRPGSRFLSRPETVLDSRRRLMKIKITEKRVHSHRDPDHVVNGELIETAPIIKHRREMTRRHHEHRHETLDES
jgi:hypothetical protein